MTESPQSPSSQSPLVPVVGAPGHARGGLAIIFTALMLASLDLRRRGYERMAALAGLELPAGSCWVLARLAKHGDAAGVELARAAGVSVAHGRPYVDRLVDHGMVRRHDEMLVLTPAGSAAAERLLAARREDLERLLADWSPEQHADLAQMLDRLSHALLGERAVRGLISR